MTAVYVTIVIGAILIVLAFWADNRSGGALSLYDDVQRYGHGHWATNASLTCRVESLLKKDGYDVKSVDISYDYGNRYSGTFSDSKKEYRIIVRTDGTSVDYEISRK